MDKFHVIIQTTGTSISKRKENPANQTLKIDEYTTMACCWSCSIFELTHLLDKIQLHGSKFDILLVGYACLYIIFYVPIFMLYLFYGRYTQKGCVTFWEITPLFRGLAWTVILYLISIELFNVSLASLAFLNVRKVLKSSSAWRFCNFSTASDECWPVNPKINYTDTCETDKSVLLSSVEYFLSNIRLRHYEIYLNDLTDINFGWVTCTIFTWIVVYFLMTRGLKSFSQITTPVAKIFVCVLLIPTLIVMLLLSGRYAIPENMRTHYLIIFTAQYWVFLFRTCLTDILPGILIVLGSYLPKDAAPTRIAFSIYGVKQLVLLTIMLWYTLTLWRVKASYKITDPSCPRITGLELFYAVIPDTLTNFPFSRVFIVLWFLSLWIYGILSTLFTLTSIIISLTENKFKFKRKNKTVVKILCISCAFFNIAILNPGFNVVLTMFQKTIVNKVPFIVIFLFCFTICLYSVSVMAEDFYFVYKKHLGKYWIYTITSLPLVTSIIFIYQAEDLTQFFVFQHSVNIKVIAYLMIGIYLLPFVFVGAKTYFYFMGIGKLKMAFKPTVKWGPPTTFEKITRIKLNSLEEFYYNTVVDCKHNCLLNSENLRIEIKHLAMNKFRLLRYLKEKDL